MKRSDDKIAKRVLETVWPWWKTKDITPETKAGGRALPRAFIQTAAMAAIGLVLYLYFGHKIMAGVVWGLGSVILASAILYPPAFTAIERFGHLLGCWVGTGLTYLLLVPFFYLVFAPAHFFLSLRGKDPMQRKFPCPDASCWMPKKPAANPNHYRKQFS